MKPKALRLSRRIRLVLGSFMFVAFFASASRAQVQRTFVSGLGSDGNPCTRTAPCRTFAQAISQTAAGGEVIVLDSSGYGPFSIGQAVSITAPPGTYAGISVFSGDGIDITAGASDTVILRGLTVNSQGGSGNGIVFSSGGTLHVENCAVNGFLNGGGAGLLFNGPGRFEVKDSIIRGNTAGIALEPFSGTAVAEIDHVRLERNILGLITGGGAKVTVRNSVASGNLNAGFYINLLSTDGAELNLENCMVNNSFSGVLADGGFITVRISNSTVTANSNGGLINGGGHAVILSRGNNTVEGNGTDTSGTIGSYTAR